MRHAKYNIRNAKNGPRVTSHQSRINAGSALILTVVLTSLLAIVGVLFVMMARVNQIASSGISESKELDAAIETVVAKISEELALDIPRKDPNGVELSEYYDYPDVNNAWLASLEPYRDGTVYKWRQISDVTGFLNDKGFSTQNVDVKPVGLSTTVYVRDYPEITLDSSGELEKQSADADGDGIADSKWVELDDITSSRGRPIYAAIRIIDNGGMLNVNTAYKFDPTESRERIDGSSQMQINLTALCERGANGSPAEAADKLQTLRCGAEPNDLSLYEQNVVWRYGNPIGTYTPFDISDELELRNRFILDQRYIKARIEDKDKLWSDAFWSTYYLWTPVDGSGVGLDDWFYKAQNDIQDPNASAPEKDYSYRHIATTYSMDRIINPSGGKMVNVNRINDINDVNSLLYPALLNGLDPCLVDVDKIAAQIAVNLKDYTDSDSEVTSFVPDVNGPTYYGFERPCVYISELAHKFVEVFPPGGPIGAPPTIYRSYAIELYKPYFEDNDPNNWRLVIGVPPGGPIGAPMVGNVYGIDWSEGEQFHVIRNENPNASLLLIDSDVVVEDSIVFDEDSLIQLQRRIDDVNGVWITVDSKYVPDADAASGWLAKDGVAHSIQRDITRHKCIRRLWSSAGAPYSPTLGSREIGDYEMIDPFYIQAHPANTGFTNVGEIGMLFRKDVYSRNWSSTDTDEEVRIDLTDPNFQQLFKYLTVFDPAVYPWNGPDETRIKGRININTAPWYVLAQLPWMQYQDSNSTPFERAKAICDKRDEPAQQGFWNIGELMLVGKMQSLGEDGLDQVGFPDLTTQGSSLGDDAVDDFEERDLIFARISNLVTVRSDVFTAYILVRIGTDGPQKRVIAILDRSDVYSPTDRVKIVAVHPVADPR